MNDMSGFPFEDLPAVTDKPCNECPWRRVSMAGHLGPYPASQWLDIVHGEGPIACHKTIKTDSDWTQPGLRQCAGSAIYRTNVHKLPHHHEVATSKEPDTNTIFARDHEFLAHHTSQER